MIIESDFELVVKKIKKGKKLWDSLIKEYDLKNNDYVLLFPHIDNEINKIGCKYIQLLINVRRPSKVFVLYVDDEVKKAVSNIYSVSAKKLDMEEKENLLLCYSLTKLTNNFLVISMTEPYGRCGEKVVERNEATIEQVVLYGIFGLSEKEVLYGNLNCF